MTDPPAVLRIGELSRRLGVSDHVLRAWERRYGLLHPVRSAGGFRLYSEADLDRVRRMQAHLAQGLFAAEAARAALAEEPATRPDFLEQAGEGQANHEGPAARVEALAQALDALDEPAAQAVLDRLFAAFTVETVLRDVLLPYLHQLGERWARGTITVAQEHFASSLLRGRLAALARGWGRGHGPQALLACAPGELHDLPLLVFGIVLHRTSWRICYLGADTPLPDLLRVTVDVRPDLVVLAAATPQRFDGLSESLTRLAHLAPLALAGAGATETTARSVGAHILTGDPVTAAERMSPPSRGLVIVDPPPEEPG